MSEMYKYVKQGMNPKKAAARMLAEKRKMAKGGMVEGSEGDLDQEHERNLAELMIQGDQPPIANPTEQDAEKRLAMNLHEESEKEEYYAMGGLVEGMDGDEKPEPHNDGIEDKEVDMPSAPLEHTLIEGVPRIKPSPLSEEAMKALARKKQMRKMMR